MFAFRMSLLVKYIYLKTSLCILTNFSWHFIFLSGFESNWGCFPSWPFGICTSWLKCRVSFCYPFPVFCGIIRLWYHKMTVEVLAYCNLVFILFIVAPPMVLKDLNQQYVQRNTALFSHKQNKNTTKGNTVASPSFRALLSCEAVFQGSLSLSPPLSSIPACLLRSWEQITCSFGYSVNIRASFSCWC